MAVAPAKRLWGFGLRGPIPAGLRISALACALALTACNENSVLGPGVDAKALQPLSYQTAALI